MPTNFNLSELTSRIVRSNQGKRIIKAVDVRPDGNGGNIISSIISGIGKLGGFLVAILGTAITFQWSTLWGLFVQTKTFIWNFNWQQTDTELDAAIKARFTAIASQAGATLGNMMGYVACGVVPGAVIAVFNEPLAAYVIKNVLEEGVEEFIANIKTLVDLTFKLAYQAWITFVFKSARKLIKANREFIVKILGGSQKLDALIKAWGEPGQKPWSFALALEEKIESIGGLAGAFLEEFAEEFDEACVEAGYIVANSVDSWYAQDMLQKKQNPVLGKERFVEVTPNREFPNKRFILGGQEALIKQELITQLATDYQLGERDLGIIYGTENNQPIRSEKPEVVLKFYQNKEDRVIGTGSNGKPVSDPNPITMQISFRLMDKSEADFIDKSYALFLAQKIYQKFAQPPFRINKGSQLFTYHDWSKGYSLNLWVSNQSEAKRVIDQVIEVQNHSFDSDKLRVGSIPVGGRKTKDKKTVLGKQQEIILPGGKTGIVTFRSAHLNIGNGTDPIVLVDLTGRKRDVVYKP